MLVLIGLGLALWRPLELVQLLAWGDAVADRPVVVALIVVAMVVLFAFGLPGSIGLWLIAPFHPPLLATILLVGASVVGALGAYGVARRLGQGWRPQGFSRRVVDYLETHGNLFTQTALRILPGFPHSVINFAGGMLGMGIGGFVTAALVGLTIKWSVYASAVHGVVEAVESGEVIQASTVYPLLALSLLLLAGVWARHRVVERSGESD